MLTKEQINKLCELGVEGFSIFQYKNKKLAFEYDGFYFLMNKTNEVYLYPLFLQRAIEAVNREGRYIIIQTHKEIKIYEQGSFFSIPEITYKYSDEAKEEGLFYYLDKVVNLD